MKSVEFLNQRAAVVAQARHIYEAAKGEGREPTAEERESFDKYMAEADTLKARAQDAERSERLEMTEAELRAAAPRKTATTQAQARDLSDHERREAFRSWTLAGTDAAKTDSDTLYRMGQAGINPAARKLSVRALSKGTTTAGGHMVPTNLASTIEKKLQYYCPIRQWARTIVTDTGATLDWPRVSDTANTASIVAEAGSIATNVDPTFDKVSMLAYKYATPTVLVSTELLQDSSIDVESLLADLLAERMARGQGVHFCTGDNSSKPQGYVTAASAVANLASGATFTTDKIIDLVHGVDVAYRQNGVFFMHDTSLASIRKLKDSDGQYLWQPGLQAGVPDRLLGYPVVVDNNMATSGDNAKLVVFGNPQHYLIRDVGPSLSLVRLDELYAATGQVGFVLLQRSDGRLVGHSGSLGSLNAEDTA